MQQAPATALSRAAQRIQTWRTNPGQFVRDVFGVTPDAWQDKGLQLLADKDKLSIRSGHGVGKSTFDSWAIFWFLSCFYPTRVPCTAPTMHQLKDVLWSELANWHRRMPKELAAQYGIRSSDQDLRVFLTATPETSFAVGRTGRKENPEALQGFHADNILFVIDEASGVDDIIFEVAQGALSTPGAKVLMTANPTRTSGYFYDSHHSMRWRYATMQVSCTDSPRVSSQYVEDVVSQYGEDSNVYRVRVLGEFPTSEDDVVIPLHLLESAVEREVELSQRVKPVWGVDVARFGDDRTALAKRQGNTLLEPVQSWRGNDTMETVGRIVQQWRHTDDKPAEILVDVIGVGSGVVDRLNELGLPVRGINVAESASSGAFMRLRDELWWRAREWLETKAVSLCQDEALFSELVEVKYKTPSDGKIQVERKSEMKKRGLNSPDIADAFVLTFAGGSDLRPPEELMDKYSRAIYRSKRRHRSYMSV